MPSEQVVPQVAVATVEPETQPQNCVGAGEAVITDLAAFFERVFNQSGDVLLVVNDQDMRARGTARSHGVLVRTARFECFLHGKLCPSPIGTNQIDPTRAVSIALTRSR